MAWNREILVEEEAAPEEERLDPDAAQRLFPVTQASHPTREIRGPCARRRPTAWGSPSETTRAAEGATQDSRGELGSRRRGPGTSPP